MQFKITRTLFSFVALLALAALPTGFTDGHSVVVAQRKPAVKKKKKAAAVYTCPMHPEVKSSKPGRCPKCGMNLSLPEETPAEHEGHAHETEPASAPSEPSTTAGTAATATTTIAPNTLKIPDTVVYNQHGRKLNFYTDLVRGKTVAINFVFTTCTTICPPLTATFRKVQQELGERVGRDIELISVSVDPTTDVPQRLKEFSAKFKAAPGWTFVTGSKPEIDQLLGALGAATADKNDHTPMLLIGNDAAGYWTRTYGLAPAATLVKVINEAASKKGGDTSRSDAVMPQPQTNASAPQGAAKTPGRLY
ncbi:MAG: SCO family protein [Acidobacteria bacterium]|nr:SCO family protein [Acidobacteriota bacterium]